MVSTVPEGGKGWRNGIHIITEVVSPGNEGSFVTGQRVRLVEKGRGPVVLNFLTVLSHKRTNGCVEIVNDGLCSLIDD